MTTQDNIKPLVERLLANPLQFKAASISSRITSRNNAENSSYIMIGKYNNNNNNSNSSSNAANNSTNRSDPISAVKEGPKQKKRKLPASMAEAIAQYTAVPVSKQVSSSDEEEEVFHEASEYVDTTSSDAVSEMAPLQIPAVIHRQPSDVKGPEVDAYGDDEDLGVPLDDPSSNCVESGSESTSTKDEKSGMISEDDEEEDDDDESPEDEDYVSSTESEETEAERKSESSENDRSSSGSISRDDENSDDLDDNSGEDDEMGTPEDILKNEKLQLQEEAIAYQQEQEEILRRRQQKIHGKQTARDPQDDEDEEELKHKSPSINRSVTPPTTVSDINKFYQWNQEPTDQGTLKSSRILKNWGPELSELKPRGLLNHGVTCYTNAAVQAMLHIPAVQHYLFDILRGKYNDIISPDSVSTVLAETSKKMWLPNNQLKEKNVTFINPKKLISRLDDINCMMSEWQQEDSHEYFMSLMSRLQEDSVPKGKKLIESVIYDIFGGLLKQIVTCKSCGGISKTEQPIYDLSLHLKGKKKLDTYGNPDSMNSSNNNDISNIETMKDNANNNGNGNNIQNQIDPQTVNRRFSIEKSIKDFFSPELIKVDKEQKGYVCEKCHKTTNAVKRNTILRAPETLLVHLKKFRFNGTSSSKMKQAVSYPMFLDLTEYCDNEGNKKILPVKYQLISVVVHEGRSLSSGHYVAHCKQPDGLWATYDDEYINKISDKEVLRETNAYYLVYSRLTPRDIKLPASLPKQKSNAFPAQNHPQHDNTSRNGTQKDTHANFNKNINGKNPKNRGKGWKKSKKKRFNKY
ncbi:hypothetical protein KAFR_0A07580 [Kazachstania africana CBS 2517]|uniref:ubiquitinyl hydrolase 1 n=1 Tax=Kazachstania africana (strain ATCC 22294 / BCRC 22015 / CBS 2517 / CECT 1963 / NBRC 1671 / NRRL Y-8276) TaxID=1071382 RepID=H2AP92_KAZAF|nr:hypothetical protein KAFR_0A07580 [Kazachstania africana CBS 2517]CCF56192.1 hypothetical protein KAFR_0A07580 [Kazachstania africana CBS 2517]